MDPISALGLAANIFQFVEIGYNVCSNGYKLYKSKSGALAETEERRTLAKNLADASRVINVSAEVRGEQPNSPIRLICESSQQITTELLDILNQLDLQSGKHKVWDSAIKSIRGVWKEKDIREMERRIASVQAQLNTILLASLEDLQIQNSADLPTLKNDLLTKLKSTHVVAGRHLHQNAEVSYAVRNLLDQIIQGYGRMSKEHQLLKSLSYDNMRRRQHNVITASPHTFDWVFIDTTNEAGPRNNFGSWLRNGGGHFWISGKAGSGKSTLMKYVFQHQNTQDFLQAWANPHQLVTASHFFWNAGATELEKSQEGLLRSLLFDILRRCSGLIPLISLPRWSETSESYDIVEQDWYKDDLVQCFRSLLKQDLGNFRFCFFIDGLDEYRGGHDDFTNLLKEIVACQNIKICVSSRPWNAFVEAFGQDGMPHFALHDFTRGDIQSYITQSLQPSFRSAAIQGTVADFNIFVDEITIKAQGVFLWVYLVVQSLKRGLTNRDSMGYLLKRIRAFPPDLEDYFMQMLGGIEEIYQAYGAQFLLMCMATTKPLPVSAINFIDLEDELYPLNADIDRWGISRLELMIPELRRRLQAHCGDLLEIVPGYVSARSTVDFLHRTVRDFLSESKVHDFLCARTTALPSPYKGLIISSLTLMKIEPRATEYFGKTLAELTLICLDAAASEEKINLNANIAYLDEVQRVNLHYDLPQKPVLIMAFERSMRLYTTYKINFETSLATRIGTFIPLDYILNGYSRDRSQFQIERITKESNVTILEYLLQKGASPNQKLIGSARGDTCWTDFLCILSTEGISHSESRVVVDMISKLLSHGADPYPKLPDVEGVKIAIESIFEAKLNLGSDHFLFQQLVECRAKTRSERSSIWKNFTSGIARNWHHFTL